MLGCKIRAYPPFFLQEEEIWGGNVAMELR